MRTNDIEIHLDDIALHHIDNELYSTKMRKANILTMCIKNETAYYNVIKEFIKQL